MQSRLQTREEAENALRDAKTKRELDVVVDAYRREGAFSVPDRHVLEEVAEAEAQRFSEGGRRVIPGSFRYGFQGVARSR